MTKRASEAALGLALREVELMIYVYKPPDGVNTNLKPCDYMVWFGVNGFVVPAWFEAKDVDSVKAFNLKELRPSQVNGIRDASRVGLEYWVGIYWRRHRKWTISNGAKLLGWWDEGHYPSVSYELLSSRFGIDTDPRNLVSTLKDVLMGDVG